VLSKEDKDKRVKIEEHFRSRIFLAIPISALLISNANVATEKLARPAANMAVPIIALTHCTCNSRRLMYAHDLVGVAPGIVNDIAIVKMRDPDLE